MTDGEICRSFRLAKDRHKQIGILADLEARSPEEIMRVLAAGGIDPLAPAPRHNRTTPGGAADHMVTLSAKIRKEVAYEYDHGRYKCGTQWL